MINRSQSARFWLGVVLPFLVFIATGSIALVLLLQLNNRQQSSRLFHKLAQTNAEFIRDIHLPPTDRFASYLSRVLGVDVHFGEPPSVDSRHEAATATIEPGRQITLVRTRSSLATIVLRPSSLAALTIFWMLSAALAWAIVHPYFQTQRLAMLGHMATALAHEIQNPVAAIRLHAQLLEPSPSSNLILDEAETIENLVNQWMFLTRPDPPQKGSVAPDQILASLVQRLTPLASHARVRILLEALPNQPIQADARRLAQAFRNIMLNSIQAMPGGGTLTIRARDGAIEFSDTGPGFTPTALTRHAELFYSEKEGGMGIGLSVTREIVQAHGGRLAVSNQPEGGALVRIEL
jgi:signal transduction histidine kinase